jgi:hypothetical protein
MTDPFDGEMARRKLEHGLRYDASLIFTGIVIALLAWGGLWLIILIVLGVGPTPPEWAILPLVTRRKVA